LAGSRYVVIAALAAAIWLAGHGTASATMQFAPVFDLSVSNANPGVRANVMTVHSVPAGNHLIDSINVFIAIDWQIEAGDTYPAANVVGQVSGKADKGCGVDAWPADITNDARSDISDIAALTSNFGQAVPPAPARHNIAPNPPNGFVDISDIVRMVQFFGTSCH